MKCLKHPHLSNLVKCLFKHFIVILLDVLLLMSFESSLYILGISQIFCKYCLAVCHSLHSVFQTTECSHVKFSASMFNGACFRLTQSCRFDSYSVSYSPRSCIWVWKTFSATFYVFTVRNRLGSFLCIWISNYLIC